MGNERDAETVSGQPLRVAVGIPTYNRGHVLLATVEQVLAQDPTADEVLVVDQSDWYPDGVRERLEALALQGSIRYVRQDTPNLPMARNRILAETQCSVVIFIDDDVRLSHGFIGAHRSNYENDDVWAVCGRITEEGIPVREVKQRTWPKILDYRYADFGWDRRDENFGTFKGCNHSVRRNVVLDLGGYDETYAGVALREETDMAFRIINAGGRIVFDPEAYLHHMRAPAGGCRVSSWGDWSAGRSVLRFALKHRKLLGRHIWSELWRAYRLGVLNGSNISHPIRIASRSAAFVRELMALSMGR